MNKSSYRPRALATVVEQMLRSHPVVVVSGARQTGKTTLMHNLPTAAQRHFETLDDLDALELAQNRPQDLLGRAQRLTIDEVQRVPELLLAIKRDVDRQRRRGRFLLTGSANLLLMKEVADSLAGRAVYLMLLPFTGSEKRGAGGVPPWSNVLRARSAKQILAQHALLDGAVQDWRQEIMRGGMPRAVLARSSRERSTWFEGLVYTYLERDLRDLSQISSLPDFRRLMGLAAHRIGQLVNQTELARDAGLSQATAYRYLNLLETTFQIHRLPPYASNVSKRLIKSPKLYWADAGLAAHLAGIARVTDMHGNAQAGFLLENLVLSALLAWRETCHPKPNLCFWRTAGGAEVDFVIELPSKLLPIEVKSGKRIRVDDLRHLEIFLSDHNTKTPFGVVLHDTKEPHMLTRKIIGLPVSWFV